MLTMYSIGHTPLRHVEAAGGGLPGECLGHIGHGRLEGPGVDSDGLNGLIGDSYTPPPAAPQNRP